MVGLHGGLVLILNLVYTHAVFSGFSYTVIVWWWWWWWYTVFSSENSYYLLCSEGGIVFQYCLFVSLVCLFVRLTTLVNC